MRLSLIVIVKSVVVQKDNILNACHLACYIHGVTADTITITKGQRGYWSAIYCYASR